MKASAVELPELPITLNLRFIRVPEPLSEFAWKAEMIKWPELAVFGVTNIPLLSVPATSYAGDAGVTTAGLYVICMSYEITFMPVRSPTVTGITTTPGVAITIGNETGMPVSGWVNSDEAMPLSCDPVDCVFEKTGAILLCIPKNSAAESRKAKWEFPAPNTVALVSRANAITAKLRPMTLNKRFDFWLLNMV